MSDVSQTCPSATSTPSPLITGNQSAGTGPNAIHGIWKEGNLVHQSEWANLSLAQPADACGNPRWDYVIKVASSQDIEAVRQVQHFILAASDVLHPNLVAVLDSSSTAAFPYLVMPRLEGNTMAWHLESAAPKKLPVALWLVRQMAQALQAMHAVGWIHGDVKPENAIVGSRGHVTVLDLGFATRTHTLSSQVFRGSPQYAAPESLSGAHAAIPAMDIFSLGRVLWQWMTRIEPAASNLIEPVAELIESMVAQEPGTRPSAKEVVKSLLRLEIETLGSHIGPEKANRRAA